MVEYSIVTANSSTIVKEDLPENLVNNLDDKNYEYLSADSLSYKEAVDLLERKLLLETMKKTRSTEEMAQLLKLDRSTVIRKLQKHKMRTAFKLD